MERTFIIRIFSFIALLHLAVFSTSSTLYGKTSHEKVLQDRNKGFTLPVVPITIVSEEAKADYFVTHFWDSFNFSDTSYIHEPQITERAFINYAQALSKANKKVASQSVTATLRKADKEKSGAMYTHFRKLFKKYFYDPYSPIRNDEIYIPVVEYVLQDNRTNAADKERMRFDLSILKKNRIGERANDFSYTLKSGQTSSLNSINNKYIILFFYNPDCHACAETIGLMKKSGAISSAVGNGKLTILAIYPDSDLEIWKKHLADIPDSWINAYDKDLVIENKRVYDLKAIPTLYLLDKDKKVLLKDTEFDVMEKWIRENL